ncbi:unnamed protein product [Schistosoma mattheei]|uniref:Uncharacterized protein n=1 Tax=Schistosoma mattheei TaxID=31246 RepID=A0A183PHG8_9TREM|nr:unnamed protein product [Schistosoma mattheei]
MDLTKPVIQQTRSPSYRTIVDLDATLSNEEDDIISIISEEFNDRDNDTGEDAHDNRLCNICDLAQPSNETAGRSTWIFIAALQCFIRFVPNTHNHNSMDSIIQCAARKRNNNDAVGHDNRKC